MRLRASPQQGLGEVEAARWTHCHCRALTAIFYPLLFIPVFVVGGIVLMGIASHFPRIGIPLGDLVLLVPFVFAHGLIGVGACIVRAAAQRKVPA